MRLWSHCNRRTRNFVTMMMVMVVNAEGQILQLCSSCNRHGNREYSWLSVMALYGRSTVNIMDASEIHLDVSAADAGHYRVSSCGGRLHRLAVVVQSTSHSSQFVVHCFQLSAQQARTIMSRNRVFHKRTQCTLCGRQSISASEDRYELVLRPQDIENKVDTGVFWKKRNDPASHFLPLWISVDTLNYY